AQRCPSERALVLAWSAIRAVVGRRSGPDAGFGIAVEPMFGCWPKYLLAARTQMTWHELQQMRAPRPATGGGRGVRTNLPRWPERLFPLEEVSILGGGWGLPHLDFPGLARGSGARL